MYVAIQPSKEPQTLLANLMDTLYVDIIRDLPSLIGILSCAKGGLESPA